MVSACQLEVDDVLAHQTAKCVRLLDPRAVTAP